MFFASIHACVTVPFQHRHNGCSCDRALICKKNEGILHRHSMGHNGISGQMIVAGPTTSLSCWSSMSASKGVFTKSHSFILVEDLHQAFKYTNSPSPTIVMLNIGSNDLARLHGVNKMAVHDMAQMVFADAEQIKCKSAVINSVLPRVKGMSCMPDVFRENVMVYNKEVKSLCTGSDKVCFNRMKASFLLKRATGGNQSCQCLHCP